MAVSMCDSLRLFVAILAMGLMSAATAAAQPVDMTPLPDGLLAEAATGDIREAWYVSPTTRYAHGVLGDAIEAGAIALKLENGRTVTLRLDNSLVFEDITPRITDLDGDGRNEVIAIIASKRRGAALAVIRMEGEQPVIGSQTRHIGRANRWLNPAGIADFDGDGTQEIALIRTPHIGGILFFYREEDGELRQLARFDGVSNHPINSRALDLSLVADIDQDGKPELIVPDQRRINLIALRFDAEKGIQAVGEQRLSSPVVGNLQRAGSRIIVPVNGARLTVPLTGFLPN
ncbi:MAG: VCBS repeat-containing protein [Pseudomonadota bacterium]